MSSEDTELEARFDDLYQQIMAGYDSLPAATWTPEYRAAKRDIQILETEFRAIGTELARRTAERGGRWTDLDTAAILSGRDAILASWAEDEAVMREAIANEDGKADDQ